MRPPGMLANGPPFALVITDPQTCWHFAAFRGTLARFADAASMVCGTQQLQAALDINDAGQIVGYGVGNGAQHAFVLTPIARADEPMRD